MSTRHTPGQCAAGTIMSAYPEVRECVPESVLARMIDELTAAPQLLEACKRLTEAIDGIRKDLGTKHPALAEAWLLASIAIAAAEGPQ